MPRLLDGLYLLAALAFAPLWLPRMARTGKLRTDWRGRLGRADALPAAHVRRVLLHAVSVGEVNALRLLVQLLRSGSNPPEIVIATTTDTGYSRARELFASACHVVRYPLDFSSCVQRFFDRVQPDAVALVELELWPNFTAECVRRGVAVCVINGRLSARSMRRYRLIRKLVRPSFRRLSFAAVQNEEYAARFVELGAPRERVMITGTMKWDTAQIADEVEGAADLAEEMGIDRGKPLIVAGSTAPDEHVLLHEAVPEGAQLLCAPRKPEWFESAAADLPGCGRRSRGERGSSTGRFLLDTIGELRKAYALADVVIIGRSFGTLHGSDMMEPIALGKATVVGPAVGDFQDVADALLDSEGVVQTDREHLRQVIEDLLADPPRRHQLAEKGRAVIRQRQGATQRHAEMLVQLLREEAGSVL